MTKTTKVFATLGVVAGLGVAALPLGSVFATPAEVSGEVDLYVDVLPAIAMTITGNNDDNSNAGSGNGAIDVFDPAGAAGKTVDGHTIPSTATTVASSSWVELLPNATGTMTSTVTVYTNNATGYTLNVKDKDSTTALTSGTNTIPASDGAVAAGTAKWNLTGGSLTNKGITATDQEVKATSTKTNNGDATTVTYNVATAADQATGTYTDTIVYTATTN